MVGWIVAFWATPTMSVGHRVWALTTTGTILTAIQIEERDLVAFFGDRYRKVQETVPSLVPFTKRGGGTE
jgi:protein-S-isoprenylcysteine O-methyltransferase Ste14